MKFGLDKPEKSEQYPDMAPTQYRPSRRNWIKLWTHEWLTGTVRWQLSLEQRAMWADVLALAGDSRFPGMVTPGEDGGKFIGYPPEYFSGLFRCPQEAVIEAFELFEKQGRIRVGDGGEIHIVNWEKYQSEYQEKRQRKQYRQKSAQAARNVRQNSARVESEVEGDVEGEKEEEGEKPTPSLEGFEIFWNAYPKGRRIGKAQTRKAWLLHVRDDKMWPEVVAGLEQWKKSWEGKEPQYVPHAQTWLNRKQWMDEPADNNGKLTDKQRGINRSVEALRDFANGGTENSGGELPSSVRGLLPRGS